MWGVLCAILLASCASRGNGVDLTVVAPASVSDQTLGRVKTLLVEATGGLAGQKRYPVEALRREERIAIDTSVSAGALTLTVTALSSDELPIATGSTDTTLVAGRAGAMITLAVPSLVVSPMTAEVTQGRIQRFTANQEVTWAVTESDGGTIDDTGLYTAPRTGTGPFHVVATSKASPDQSATATVTLLAPGISLLAGALGGPGVAPGNGSNARVTSVYALGRAANSDVYYVGDVNGVVFKLTPPSTLEHVAGRPYAGLSTNGVGSAATFTRINAIFVDDANDRVVISDVGTVRVLTLSTRAVTTVPTPMGRPGRAGGIVVVGNDAYLSVQTRSTINRVDLTTGASTDIAGGSNQPGFVDNAVGTSARFSAPSGVALIESTLYVADTGNHRIRAVDLTNTNAVTTLVGTDVAGCDGTNPLSSPVGLTTDGLNLYVTDTGTHTIRLVNVAAKAVSTYAGTCNMPGTRDGTRTSINPALVAQLNVPIGIVPNTEGTEFFVGEQSSGVLRSIVGMAVSTPIGTRAQTGTTDGPGSVARFGGPPLVASDGARVFVSDSESKTLRCGLDAGRQAGRGGVERRQRRQRAFSVAVRAGLGQGEPAPLHR